MDWRDGESGSALALIWRWGEGRRGSESRADSSIHRCSGEGGGMEQPPHSHRAGWSPWPPPPFPGAGARGRRPSPTPSRCQPASPRPAPGLGTALQFSAAAWEPPLPPPPQQDEPLGSPPLMRHRAGTWAWGRDLGAGCCPCPLGPGCVHLDFSQWQVGVSSGHSSAVPPNPRYLDSQLPPCTYPSNGLGGGRRGAVGI